MVSMRIAQFRQRERLLLAGLSFATGVVLACILRTCNPATDWFFPPCPFRALTGLLCPGCGTLRALHELLNGHLFAALRLNPLMMLLLPYVGYSATMSGLEFVTMRRLTRVFIPPACIWVLLAVILTFWIVRNIPPGALS